jgi:hypothetical protein
VDKELKEFLLQVRQGYADIAVSNKDALGLVNKMNNEFRETLIRLGTDVQLVSFSIDNMSLKFVSINPVYMAVVLSNNCIG